MQLQRLAAADAAGMTTIHYKTPEALVLSLEEHLCIPIRRCSLDFLVQSTCLLVQKYKSTET
jgi:hypothetical protein